MSLPVLIEVDELSLLLRQDNGKLLAADCRYALTDPHAGAQAYAQGHIPGAVHADLGTLLSSAPTGTNGRHPLPDPQVFAQGMAALGADDDTLVVAYDAEDAMFAARLWWLLRWIGHEKVRVLNGGLRAWVAAGGELSTTQPDVRPGTLRPRSTAMPTTEFSAVLGTVSSREKLLIDARSPDRYRGENETIDPVGGHIPGARNRFFKENVGADGKFKAADQLRAEFEQLLAGAAPEDVIHQCGSGVSACHNLLAMEVAGLGGGTLYPGSWSEWSSRPDAPVALG